MYFLREGWARKTPPFSAIDAEEEAQLRRAALDLKEHVVVRVLLTEQRLLQGPVALEQRAELLGVEPVLVQRGLILKRETLGKEELTQSRIRLHITDALLCQFHHGDQSRPDFATALNELWFSEDPVALDTLSHQLIAQLRSSLKLPVRSNPRKLLRYASKMMLGTDSTQSMQIETISLQGRASE